MAKKDYVRSGTELCADSRHLIDQSTILITGSGDVCAATKIRSTRA
jgi:hypothetical protein